METFTYTFLPFHFSLPPWLSYLTIYSFFSFFLSFLRGKGDIPFNVNHLWKGRTGKHGVLQSMGSQHWAMERNWTYERVLSFSISSKASFHQLISSSLYRILSQLRDLKATDLCHQFQAMWPVSSSAKCHLSFLICKMGVAIHVSQELGGGLNEILHMKHLAQCLIHMLTQ